MSNDLKATIESLDDKQAIYVAQKLAEAVFGRTGVPEYSQMVNRLAQAEPTLGVQIISNDEVRRSTLAAGDGGTVARAVLMAWANNSEAAPAVEAALDRYSTSKQDLGILSVPLALGLSYALVAMDLDLDLGFVRLKKKGLSSRQQADVVKKTISPLLKVLQLARR